MRVEQLARQIEARLIVPGRPVDREISRVYGANTMSDLIANAAADTLLVTALCNTQLIRVADLMDVPAICFVDGNLPAPDLAAHARESGAALIVAPGSLQSTLDSLASLFARGGEQPA
ncbi:MAG TPA: hypothetical protein VMV03_04345 [Spirochaetia bacterium]|nr:hypothetical protein [Spirochaetia bacterium]